MVLHFGFTTQLVLVIDAKATEHILYVQGIGRVRHTDVAHSCLHDEVRSNRLTVHRAESEHTLG